MGKVTTKSVLIWVVIVALLVGVIGFISGGFTKKDVTDWVKVRNSENLLDYVYPVEDKLVSNLILNIDENGVIRIRGDLPEKLGSNGKPTYIQWTYNLGKVTLPAGTYTLSCEGARSGYAILCGQYKDANGKTKDWTGYSARSTLTFYEPTEVSFTIRILKSGPINTTLYPIVNKGYNPIDYYVTRTIGN